MASCNTGIVQGNQNEITMLLIDDKMLCEYLLKIVSIKLHVTGSQTKRQKIKFKRVIRWAIPMEEAPKYEPPC